MPQIQTMPLPPIEEDEGILTIPQTQIELADCSRNTVLRLAAKGILDARKDGRRTVITRKSVRRRKLNLPPAVLKPDPRCEPPQPAAPPVARARLNRSLSPSE
jgi:hypothetical protein